MTECRALILIWGNGPISRAPRVDPQGPKGDIDQVGLRQISGEDPLYLEHLLFGSHLFHVFNFPPFLLSS